MSETTTAALIFLMMVLTTYLIINGTRRQLRKPHSLSEIHGYWRNPSYKNRPESYLEPKNRSLFLTDIFAQYMGNREGSILEIGCNVGRNLNYLFEAGYHNLNGIEINEETFAIMAKEYPEMWRHSWIFTGPIENCIGAFQDGRFDTVFTMATLQHIHPDSEWIFAEIARITGRLLITVEDEGGITKRHYPRNYRQIFMKLGATNLMNFSCTRAGLGDEFIARVFTWER